MGRLPARHQRPEQILPKPHAHAGHGRPAAPLAGPRTGAGPLGMQVARARARDRRRATRAWGNVVSDLLLPPRGCECTSPRCGARAAAEKSCSWGRPAADSSDGAAIAAATAPPGHGQVVMLMMVMAAG